MRKYQQSRGWRNNNPLNIRRGEEWQGLVAKEKRTDGAFCQFLNMTWGYRAAARCLRSYYQLFCQQGRAWDVENIISRWAPASENKTEAYIANVSRLTGILPDEPIGIPSDQPSRWIALGAAMAIQENGTESMDWFAMLRGWAKARKENDSRDLSP